MQAQNESSPGKKVAQIDYFQPSASGGNDVQRGCARSTILVAVALAMIFFAGLILLLLKRTPRISAQQYKCAANLKNISLGCLIYCNNHNGRFPDRLEDLLLSGDLSPENFVCPDSSDSAATGSTAAAVAKNLSSGGHCSYIYVGKGLTDQMQNPDRVVVAYEPLSNHHGQGINMVFADGRVRWLTGPSLAWILANYTSQPIYPPTTTPATAP